MRDAVSQLPGKLPRIVDLIYREGKTQKTVGDMLELSRDQVAKKCAQAKETLKRSLAQYRQTAKHVKRQDTLKGIERARTNGVVQTGNVVETMNRQNADIPSVTGFLWFQAVHFANCKFSYVSLNAALCSRKVNVHESRHIILSYGTVSGRGSNFDSSYPSS